MSIQSQNAEAFSLDGVSITSGTYVYSNWVKSDDDNIAILSRVATLNATSLTLTIQGRHDNTYSNVGSICTLTYTAAQAVADVHLILPKFKQMRIGAKIDVTATPNNFYAGIVRSSSK